MDDPETVVRRYYSTVADLTSAREALLEVLHPDVRVTEHPNAITPAGAVRDRDAVAAAFEAGKGLLAEQVFDIDELIVSGQRVAVRATWRGTIADGVRGFAAGAELVAHVASWLTVEDGLIHEHETFDCYEPLPGPRA